MLSLDETADRLNELLWQNALQRQRRKSSPRQYQGTRIRTERKCPNGDQVRKYRNGLPSYLVKTLNEFIIQCQLEYAFAHQVITHQIDLLVDNTAEWYYGSARYPKNPFITGGYNGPGTKYKRNYLVIMLKSQSTYLFCNWALIPKHGTNVPIISQTVDWLIQMGFHVRYVMADRWFPTYALLAELQLRGVHYLGPYRKWAPIRRILLDFLATGKHYIRSYWVKGAPAQHYRHPKIQVWLIIVNRRGKRLREICSQYQKGIRTQEESLQDLLVMVTTEPPPKGKKAQQGWAVRLCQQYDHRWQIETGFRDLHRIAPPSNARTNTRKVLMFSVRIWIFNLWQLERAVYRHDRRRRKYKTCTITLRRFSRICVQSPVVDLIH